MLLLRNYEIVSDQVCSFQRNSSLFKCVQLLAFLLQGVVRPRRCKYSDNQIKLLLFHVLISFSHQYQVPLLNSEVNGQRHFELRYRYIPNFWRTMQASGIMHHAFAHVLHRTVFTVYTPGAYKVQFFKRFVLEIHESYLSEDVLKSYNPVLNLCFLLRK